jgi:hypothetical protein
MGTGLVLVLAAASAPTFTQDEPDEVRVPVVARPERDFYNAIGTGVTLKAVASPTQLTTADWTTFTLTIDKLDNAPDVEKPSLHALAEFQEFQVVETPDLDPPLDPATPGRRVFVYRLRPASESVALIPEIPFAYFDPKRVAAPDRPRDRFPKTFSNAIPIRVTWPVQPPAAVVPLEVPTFAAELAPASESPLSIPSWAWPVGLAAPPMLALGWVALWRRLYPDAARLARLKRIRAVRAALKAFAAARGRDDPPAAVADAFLGYLRERFGLSPFARTPAEVADALRAAACAPGDAEAVASFLRACDAARFAPAHAADDELADEAERLVVSLEGAT